MTTFCGAPHLSGQLRGCPSCKVEHAGSIVISAKIVKHAVQLSLHSDKLALRSAPCKLHVQEGSIIQVTSEARMDAYL